MMCNNGKISIVGKLSWILIIVGALNWGLVGLGGFLNTDLNVVQMLLGGWPMVMNLVYLLVGVAAIAKLMHKKCGTCTPPGVMKS